MNKVDIIRILLREHGKHHDNYFCMRRWYWQWFYTIKAVICVALGLTGSDQLNEIDAMAHWGYRESYSMEWGNGADWEGISVGYGIFRRWFYNEYTDGYP